VFQDPNRNLKILKFGKIFKSISEQKSDNLDQCASRIKEKKKNTKEKKDHSGYHK